MSTPTHGMLRFAALAVSGMALIASGCSSTDGSSTASTTTTTDGGITTVASASTTAQTTTTTAATSSTEASTTLSTSEPTFFGKVDIGGRRLFLNCQGVAHPDVPAVVFESGLGGSASSWRDVQRTLSGSTLACVYDRAGVGQSDPPARTPHTARDQAEDLTALLSTAGVPGPYIFVSHSLGPWTTVIYATLHPGMVAGMVFVDPRGPDVSQDWIAALTAMSGTEANDVEDVLAKVMDYEDDPTSNDEDLDVKTSEQQVREALQLLATTVGSTPVVILTATGTPEDWSGLPDGPRKSWDAGWLAGQDAYALGTTVQRISVESSHMIQEDQPNIVVDATAAILAKFPG